MKAGEVPEESDDEPQAVEAELLDRVFGAILDSGERVQILEHLAACAAEFPHRSFDPREAVRQRVREAQGGEGAKRQQLWMLFQLAERVFPDPEEFRRLLYLEQWARQVGVARQAREVYARLIRSLVLAMRVRED
jgi:hypothetical protein